MSYQINLADVRGYPQADELARLMRQYGAPEREEYRVVDVRNDCSTVWATIARMHTRNVTILSDDSGEFEETSIQLAKRLDLRASTITDTLVTSCGGRSSLDEAAVFLGSCLALPTVVEPWILDVQAVVETMLDTLPRCQLRTVNVGEYCHNSYMAGPYRPRFLDSSHGREFVEAYGEAVKEARLRWAGEAGWVSATIRPNGSITYTCGEEEANAVDRRLLDICFGARAGR